MSTTSVTTQLVAVTPLEIFLQLAAGSFEAIRVQNESKTYIPAQFGGVIGQLVVGNNASVMQLTNFKVN